MIKKYIGFIILLLGFCVFYIAFDLHKISNLPIGSYHCWRQADCVSMTNEFYTNQASILKPTTHFTKEDGTRIAAGEFPIINVLVATIYKLTGNSLKAYRYTIYLFYLIGFIFLYFIFYDVSKSYLASALFSLLLSLSSVLMYYAINVLPDVPALSIGIASLYFWLLARKKEKISYFILPVFLITIASLIKLTMLILLISYLIVISYEFVFKRKRTKELWIIVLLLLSMIPIVSWYYYAYQLDHTHPPFIFLTETRSYWNTYYIEKPLIWNQVVHIWLPQVYSSFFLYSLIGIGFIFLFFKKVRLEYKFMFISVSVGSICFFMIMYRQFLHHDYLWVCLLIVVIICSVVIMYSFGMVERKEIKISFNLFLVLCMLIQFYETKNIMYERYFKFDNSLNYHNNLIGLNEKLRLNGIRKTDLVLSIPDISPNISLTIMDQYGFTLYREQKTKQAIDAKIKSGAKYLIVTDANELNELYLKPFIHDTLFTYNEIWVYKLAQ